MADAVEINPATMGMAGKKVVVATSDEIDSDATVSTPLSVVEHVFLTAKGSISDPAVRFSWSASGGTITIHATALDADVLSVMAIGY